MSISPLAFLLALTTSGSPVSAPDVFVPAEEAQVARLQAHYAAVVGELEAADVSRLTVDQRSERARLIGVLRDFGECGEFGHMAANGSAEAMFALQELSRSETGSKVRRAAAMEGLGMILAPNPPLAFADVSRETNYTVFTDWVAAIFQTTL